MKSRMFKKYFDFLKKDSPRSENETESVNSTPKAEEYERCVMCGAITCIPVSMHIDLRENYEVGFGQICPECAKKLQRDIKQENRLYYEQIASEVEKSRKERNH